MRTVIHVTVVSFLMIMFLVMSSNADSRQCALEGLDLSFGDTLPCDKKIQNTFICKKNLFSSPEEFKLSHITSACTKEPVGYCINGETADEMPPWVLYSIEKTDDLEKTLVIDPQKPSAAVVTRKRKFSSSEGYTWDEEKYYCKYE